MPETPELRGGLPLIAFSDAPALEDWLERQPPDHAGIWLKLAKNGSGIASVTKSEAVDAGLCFGWIDGQLNAYDHAYFLVRFTPRRRRSKWSLVNVERAEALIAAGRIRPGGMREIEAARADGRWAAAYPPQSRIEVPADLQAALDGNPQAAAFFAGLSGANRYALLYRLHAVTDPAKREQAIAGWVAMLVRGETFH
jgi:uncharacterized protein YdeI (YjbR/CyaY-like superfamily)